MGSVNLKNNVAMLHALCPHCQIVLFLGFLLQIKMDSFPKLKNDLFIRMCYNEEVIKEVPVWIMRQAGRYLPEFREIRKSHDFFEICENPELASQVTLMPIERFRLDAAIIFSDILVIPKALGMHIKMVEKVGPVIEDPIRNAEDFEKFYKLERKGILEKLRHVGEALRLTRTKLDGCVPLIGFSGGPWTLLAYMIEGGGSKTFSNAKKWLYCNVTETKSALRFLSELIVSYLRMQIENGAQALQLFESCAEYLSPRHFRSFLMPELDFIFSDLHQFISERALKVPLILFAKGCYHSIEEQDRLAIEVIGIDWTVNGKEARTKTKKTLQGNLDPPALYATDADLLQTVVTEMLHDFNSSGKESEPISGYIANLGHGIYPDTPVENVERFINVVHSFKRN